jgi:hypothetical protein
VKAEPATAGANSDFSATLHVADGVIFCKGVMTNSPRARMHRHEALVNPWLPLLAPRLLWRVDTDGWLLLGFEHAAGRHANLSPASPDLPLVADAVTTLAWDLTPCPVADVPRLADQWQRLSAWHRLAQEPPADLDPWTRENLSHLVEWETRAIELVDGDSLAHTDLHSLNILVADRARVIDWAWSRRAAAWVDTAFLIIRLIDAGHTCGEAEQWAHGIPTWDSPMWDSVLDTALTAFAVAVTGMWEHRTRQDPKPFRAGLTASARRWAQHRLG